MIGIVVPVYNEGSNIIKLFNEIRDCIESKKEVMIVYDFEEDDTIPVAKEIMKGYDFVIRFQKNKYGKGALNAIRTGMDETHGKAVLVVMADLSDGLGIVDSMYNLIQRNEADLVCGSRYMKGGHQHGGPFLKGLMSRTAGVSLHILSGIPTHDVTNSFKMYRKKMLEHIQTESDGGFEIGMEICVKAYLQGYKIAEVPAEWFDRAEGQSRFKMWEWIPHYLHWYMLCILGKKKRRKT